MRDAAFCRELLRAAYTLTCAAAPPQPMAAMKSQPANPSVGSGDGDAVTDSFKDGVIHALWVEVLVFRKAGGMVMFNEKADAKGVMKTVYNNPLDMWHNKAMGLPAAF